MDQKWLGFDSLVALQMKKEKKPKDPLREAKRAELRKQREIRKFAKSVTGFSRIGRNNV